MTYTEALNRPWYQLLRTCGEYDDGIRKAVPAEYIGCHRAESVALHYVFRLDPARSGPIADAMRKEGLL